MPRIHTAMPSGPPAMHHELAQALSIIRTNCHISDALHATDYTLCVYLLKMREYYRWEHGIPFNASIPQKALSGWLTGREALWSRLEGKPFASIPLSSRLHAPFDAEPINAVLNRMGYVYSSGLGRNLKPHFFLGVLEQRREHAGYTVYISGKEYAPIASPTTSSAPPDAYISAVSMWVISSSMPSFSARTSSARDAALTPISQVPCPITGIFSGILPKVVYRMGALYPVTRRALDDTVVFHHQANEVRSHGRETGRS